MSMASNKLFVDTLRNKFSDLMTASVMEQALDTVACVLTEYEIERIMMDDPNKDFMLDAYLDALQVEAKSEKTIRLYRDILEKMLREVGVSSSNVSAYHIRKFLSDEKARGLADSTIRQRYSTLSSYFGWLHRDGLIRVNPMSNICPPKVAKKVMETYSDIDMEKLKSGCKCLRDKCIVYLLKSSGCRISEITGLNRDDVDLVNRQFVVLGKGNKQRTAFMDVVTASLLKKYLESRTDDIPALFVGLRKERLHPDGVRYMLKQLGKAVGVEHVHPHKFRRTEATELSKRGMPIQQVQRFLGHERIDTTMRYVNIDQEDVRSNYRKLA